MTPRRLDVKVENGTLYLVLPALSWNMINLLAAS